MARQLLVVLIRATKYDDDGYLITSRQTFVSTVDSAGSRRCAPGPAHKEEGTDPGRVDPLALELGAETGIEIDYGTTITCSR